MKSLISILILSLSYSTAAFAENLKYRETTCNIYYNNMGKVFGPVPCKAWFNQEKSISRINVYFPNAKRWYDWSTIYSNVTLDPRWKECIRHTNPEGNQYQVCTEKSPKELNI